MVEFGPKLRVGGGERLPALLRMGAQIAHSRLQGGEEFTDLRLMNCVAMGDNHQLVIGRHAVIFDVHHHRRFALQLQLLRFYITIAADNRVHLAGQQGAGQLEIDVHQFDAGRIDPCMLRHGRQGGLLNAADRVAHLLALQICRGFDLLIQGDNRIQRRINQCPYTHQR